MYDQLYLKTIARIAANEGMLSRDDFDTLATSWMPTQRDSKTKALVFPLEEDYEFA